MSDWVNAGDALDESLAQLVESGECRAPVDDPIVSRLCPTCEQPTARYHLERRALVCMNRHCSARYRVVAAADIEAALERRVDRFLDLNPGLRPGSSHDRVVAVAEDLLRRGVRPRLVLEIVTAWAQPYAALGLEDACAAVQEAAARLAKDAA